MLYLKHRLKYYYVQIKRTVTGSRYRYADYSEEYLSQISEKRREEIRQMEDESETSAVTYAMVVDGWFKTPYAR
jgi:hypothetical protein